MDEMWLKLWSKYPLAYYVCFGPEKHAQKTRLGGYYVIEIEKKDREGRVQFL